MNRGINHFESARQKIDNRHVRESLALQTAHVDPDVKLFAQFRARRGFVVLAENFPINFEPVAQCLIRNLSIESRFNDLEKRTRSAQTLRRTKPNAARAPRNLRAQQRFHSICQSRFGFVFVQLDDAELRRILRDRVRVGFQRANCVSRRKRVEFAVTDRFENIFELFR